MWADCFEGDEGSAALWELGSRSEAVGRINEAVGQDEILFLLLNSPKAGVSGVGDDISNTTQLSDQMSEKEWDGLHGEYVVEEKISSKNCRKECP